MLIQMFICDTTGEEMPVSGSLIYSERACRITDVDDVIHVLRVCV